MVLKTAHTDGKICINHSMLKRHYFTFKDITYKRATVGKAANFKKSIWVTNYNKELFGNKRLTSIGPFKTGIYSIDDNFCFT